MRFGRQNSDDSGEEEMYVRAASELTTTRLPRNSASEQLPTRPAKKVSIQRVHVQYYYEVNVLA